MANVFFDKRRRTWQIRKQFKDPRTGKIHRLHKTLPKGATRTAAKHVAEQMDKRARGIKLGILGCPESIESAKNRWLLHIRQNTDRTRGHYEEVIGRFIEGLPESVLYCDQITRQHIEDYIISLLENGLKNRTGNAHLTPIKAFCGWFSDMYSIHNPADRIRMLREDPPNARFLTEEEYVKIMDAADDSFRERLGFIANTGLRASEFCGLTWGNIGPDGKSITITGKGRKRRTVPLNSLCLEILDKIRPENPDPGEVIFKNGCNKKKLNGGPIGRRRLYEQCVIMAKALKMPKFGPHSFRHRFATQLLLRGVDIAYVSKLLGHGSTKFTEKVYIHILPKHLAGLTECLV